MAETRGYIQRNVQDVAVISFSEGRILDAGFIEQLGADLGALIAKEPRTRFVLDFSAVSYMSSAALAMLVSLQKKVAAKGGGELNLAGIRESIMEVFRITKLDKVFSIHRNARAAVEAFQQGP